jgi:putative chitinase
MISIDQIVKATGCSREGITNHYQSFVEVCLKYEINTLARIAAFLANAIHETGGFRQFEENLNYSAKGLMATWPARFNEQTANELARKPEMIANHVYFKRNGNELIGDGWKFRGRGIFQTTGKANYKLAGAALKIDCVEHPEILSQAPYAMQSAGFYWHTNKLNQDADLHDITRICRKINGGENGLKERKELFEKLLSIKE